MKTLIVIEQKRGCGIMSYLLGVINLLSWGEMSAVTQQCVEKPGVALFVGEDALPYNKQEKLPTFASFLSVSSFWFEVATSACPAAAAAASPVAVSLWQHCPHVVKRKTICNPLT